MVVFQERNERSRKQHRVAQREQLERWSLKESSENLNENKTKKIKLIKHCWHAMNYRSKGVSGWLASALQYNKQKRLLGWINKFSTKLMEENSSIKENNNNE